jgi:hypothetical protein
MLLLRRLRDGVSEGRDSVEASADEPGEVCGGY